METVVQDLLPCASVICNWSDKDFCVLGEEQNRQNDEPRWPRGRTLLRWSEDKLNSHSHSALAATDPNYFSTDMEPMLFHSLFTRSIHPEDYLSLSLYRQVDPTHSLPKDTIQYPAETDIQCIFCCGTNMDWKIENNSSILNMVK